MSDDLAARSGVPPRADRLPTERVRWGMRAVSGGVLVLATVMGVRLGLDGPAISPVSPTAMTARYGAPPARAPAGPPVEAAAAPPVEVPVAPPPAEVAVLPPVEVPVVPQAEVVAVPSAATPAAAIAESVMRRGRQHDQHDGGGHD